MEKNWRLFYRKSETGEIEFAELLFINGHTRLKSGKVFTQGQIMPAESFEACTSHLIKEGYQLERQWFFDLSQCDESTLIQEIHSVISNAKEFASSNALAIITDPDFTSLSFALKNFDDIESTEEDALWIVDNWCEWNKDWRLDPAYRWLLAYGDPNQLNDNEHRRFCLRIRQIFLHLLRSYSNSKDILIIYTSGSNHGYRWSADCMEDDLAERLLTWI
ncbi:hypothetical protein [Marinospirillum sp.]|uniref:hypothetical protein n=1 Tax=Marinospirillum sp. TaxID=2183934 RepID=UPI003A8376E2